MRLFVPVLAVLILFLSTPSKVNVVQPVRIVSCFRWNPSPDTDAAVKDKITIQNDLFQSVRVYLDCTPFENEIVEVSPRTRTDFYIVFPIKPNRLPGCDIAKFTAM